MKMQAYVLEDVSREWTIQEKSGSKSGTTRTITVLDRDQGESRLLQPLKVKLSEKDVNAGPVGSLRDAVVEIAITRIDQQERTKELGVSGHVLSVAGSMQFKPAAAESKKAA